MRSILDLTLNFRYAYWTPLHPCGILENEAAGRDKTAKLVKDRLG
jgi:hypothetical protein